MALNFCFQNCENRTISDTGFSKCMQNICFQNVSRLVVVVVVAVVVTVVVDFGIAMLVLMLTLVSALVLGLDLGYPCSIMAEDPFNSGMSAAQGNCRQGGLHYRNIVFVCSHRILCGPL
jgi:type IV secretory pathway TrbL component